MSIPWFSYEALPGVWVGFTDTTHGNLAFHVNDDPLRVSSNRAALENDLAVLSGSTEPVTLAYMNQVHGSAVAIVDGTPTQETVSGVPTGPTADAMLSRSTSLAVMVADCVPVVLVGSDIAGRAVLAVAHAGRPGVEKKVIAAIVRQLRAAGAVKIQAWIGPSVCGRCYEVPHAMRSAVAAVEATAFATTSWGTPSLDLPAAVTAQLRSLDVLVDNVGVCTLEHPEFFSHRRALRDGEEEGRFIGFVTLTSPSF
ncbi:polyphenol oxidase family protein [Arthrobacter cryoconiti]|uniref:Polyphenol oxidase family protein n=1 Tax=Arthrobacter cryoconiti TaxID=748907 RepID=A0ABV8R0H7_9MICC|nr:polyphenol oxidase family protein [Arthrobacter cryoconiti]MCC9069100.1 polyphenol oxidase family protein [Arthrobacter cryoconiti]